MKRKRKRKTFTNFVAKFGCLTFGGVTKEGVRVEAVLYNPELLVEQEEITEKLKTIPVWTHRSYKSIPRITFSSSDERNKIKIYKGRG